MADAVMNRDFVDGLGGAHPLQTPASQVVERKYYLAAPGILR